MVHLNEDCGLGFLFAESRNSRSGVLRRFQHRTLSFSRSSEPGLLIFISSFFRRTQFSIFCTGARPEKCNGRDDVALTTPALNDVGHSFSFNANYKGKLLLAF